MGRNPAKNNCGEESVNVEVNRHRKDADSAPEQDIQQVKQRGTVNWGGELDRQPLDNKGENNAWKIDVAPGGKCLAERDEENQRRFVGELGHRVVKVCPA